jgi:hypothetical protein
VQKHKKQVEQYCMTPPEKRVWVLVATKTDLEDK